MNISSATINVVALLIAVTFHEFAHAWTAWRLGDDTAINCGRLSFNPKNHIDVIGTVLLPIMLILARSPVILGWAKPVPVNPLKFKNSQIGLLLTSLSGPAMNLLLALVLLFFIKLFFVLELYYIVFLHFLHVSVKINIFLAFFNLIPIHPLDGYNAFVNFLPPNLFHKVQKTEPYGILILATLFYFDILDRVIVGSYKIIINLLL